MLLAGVMAWTWSRRAFALAVIALAVVIDLAYLHIGNDTRDAIWMGRNFYGALKIRDTSARHDNYRRRLVHGAILHGEHVPAGGERRPSRRPTTPARPGIGRAIDIKERERRVSASA
jgi:hypothetical protein